MTSLASLPGFLAYFGASLVLLAAFLAAYTLIVPLHEWTLVRQGNVAVALSLAGATVGFALPLASAIVHSANIADMAVWAGVALILQLLCFAAMRLLRRHAAAALAQGDMAEAILLATFSVVFGLLNAACLS
jgi:putative membrane protein